MIDLSLISTLPPDTLDQKAIKQETDDLCERLGDLQKLLYANQQHAVLVVFQGMDASGKDGANRKVFRDCNPSGVAAFSFKKPTDEELAHDFLWRVHDHTPPKGMIHIFNRSHYEDILIQRVHQWVSEERVEKRMASINAFEDLLQYDNNTLILKFYLHISFDQQAKELQERIDEADKHWKHNDNDWKEREYWQEYQRCYEYAINNSLIPWHIIPVDKRWYRDYLITKTIVEALEKLEMTWPALETERR